MQDQGWKLIAAHRPQKNWLFNLQSDPTEQHNLADTQPAKLAQLQALLATHHAQMPASLWPSFIELPVTIDKTLNQKQKPDDIVTYWVN